MVPLLANFSSVPFSGRMFKGVAQGTFNGVLAFHGYGYDAPGGRICADGFQLMWSPLGHGGFLTNSHISWEYI